MGGDFPPACTVARTGTGHGTVNDTLLQSTRHFTEAYANSFCAKRFKQFAGHTAGSADLLAFEIGERRDFRVAEHNLRRIGCDTQNLSIEDILIDVVDQRTCGFDHHFCRGGIGCDQRHIETLKGRSVGHRIVRNGHANVENAFAKHPENIAALDAHLVMGRQFCGDLAAAGRWHFLVPEGLFVEFVKR